MIRDMHERLKSARQKAGFRTASDAADRFGWSQPTYRSHENGTRGLTIDTAKVYAQAFRVEPAWLAFGDESTTPKIAGVSRAIMNEILLLVLSSDGREDATPEQLAQVVLDIAEYVLQSGTTGLENVVDFQMHRVRRRA